jgi:hypothetical protein
MIRHGLCAIALLASCAHGADEPGVWRLKDRQLEKPRPVKPGGSCSFTFDDGAQGLSFTQTCLWPDRKRTSTTRCHFSWRSNDLGSLTPGQKVGFTGTISNLGDQSDCTGYIVLGTPGVSAVSATVPVRVPGVTRTGEFTIPGKLVNPRTGQVNPLRFSFHLTAGNETKFLIRHLVYEWTPTRGQAATPPPAPAPAAKPPVAPGPVNSSHLGCYADKDQRDLNATPAVWVRDASACVQSCAGKGYRYAAVQAGSQCFCGNSFGKYGTSAACKPCSNTPKEFCGGNWGNSVYEIKK